MGYSEILLYCRRAAGFALPFGAIWLAARVLWQLMRRRKISARREALYFVFAVYLAALLQITVWRSGPDWQAIAQGGGHAEAQLTLLGTTLRHWRVGGWTFVYHAVGNLGWFLPFGLLLPPVRRRWNLAETVLAGMLLSTGIEALQWFLRTGITDIDDVLLNALGALLGYLIAATGRGISRHARTTKES